MKYLVPMLLAALSLPALSSCRSSDERDESPALSLTAWQDGRPIASAERALNGDSHIYGKNLKMAAAISYGDMHYSLGQSQVDHWRVEIDGKVYEGRSTDPLPRVALLRHPEPYWNALGLTVAPE